MPASDSFEFDYTPGYQKPTHEYGTPYGDEFHAEAVQELLLSMAGYTQRGVTLGGGQGVISAGTVLARQASDGKYYVYNSKAVSLASGLGTALGVLRDSRDTGTGTNGISGTGLGGAATSPAGKVATDCQGNLVIRGLLNANMVSGTDTLSVAANTGGGIGTLTSGTSNQPGVLVQLGGRVMAFGGSLQSGQFPGGLMDGNNTAGTAGVNAFVF